MSPKTFGAPIRIAKLGHKYSGFLLTLCFVARRVVAILTQGRVHLHPLETPGSSTDTGSTGGPESERDIMFPNPRQPNDITCVALTPQFLIYGTER